MRRTEHGQLGEEVDAVAEFEAHVTNNKLLQDVIPLSKEQRALTRLALCSLSYDREEEAVGPSESARFPRALIMSLIMSLIKSLIMS